MALLHQRAALYRHIRAFFDARGVLEVETPLLSGSTATDPQLASYSLSGVSPGYLQTSPEFAMKRLLAAGSGPIYQICKCFREAESGRRHNPEFTMLEWYRPEFDLEQLMGEVTELVEGVLGDMPTTSLSYRELFCRSLNLDPHRATIAELQQAAASVIDVRGLTLSRDAWLDLLMSHSVEPGLAGQGAVLVFDFPASQAALSSLAVDGEGDPVARRFELYIEGVELANGYLELRDGDELERRFLADNSARVLQGLPEVPIDRRLLAAHHAGLPPSAGVALGLDRLLMLAAGLSHIDQVLAFSSSRV